MVKFDFDTYSKNYIDEEIFSKNFNRKEEVFSKSKVLPLNIP